MSRLFLTLSLLASAAYAAEPTDHLFPADRDGAPAPLAPIGEPRPPVDGDAPMEGPRRQAGALLREKASQLKEAGITREDMQRIRAALEQAREDEAVKAARKKADAAQDKLRSALRAYAEANGIEPPEFPAPGKFRPEAGKDKSQPSPEPTGERKVRKQEGANRKPELSPEKMAEIRKAMEGARNDPTVKAAFEESRAAGEALRQAVRAAMLKADPSLGELLDKLGDLREVFREDHVGAGFQKRPFVQGDKPEGIREEKPRSPKMMAALEAANADPAVKAARKAAEEAKARLGEVLKAYGEAKGIPKPDKNDPEAMAAHRKAMEEARNDPAVKAAFEQARLAGQALHEATKEAVLKADPSLADEFDKPAPVRQPKGDKKVGA